MALPLYGHEIHAAIDPISAGLGFAVRLDKGEFLGRDALLKVRLEGPATKLAGFEMTERGVPRQGYDVLIDGVAAGKVTSGLYSPTTERYVGMAYLPAAQTAPRHGTDCRDPGETARRSRCAAPIHTPAYRRSAGGS